MPLLLHLSDLHLVAPGKESVIGDFKSSVVRKEDQPTTIAALEKTLRELRGVAQLKDSKQPLDAIVVSGDVTFHGKEPGFARLPGVLGHLGDLHPAPNRVVVVPGNHDVEWETRDPAK